MVKAEVHACDVCGKVVIIPLDAIWEHYLHSWLIRSVSGAFMRKVEICDECYGERKDVFFDAYRSIKRSRPVDEDLRFPPYHEDDEPHKKDEAG